MLEYGQWIKTDKLIVFFAVKSTLAWSQKMRVGLLFADLTKNNDTICNHSTEPKTNNKKNHSQHANVYSLENNWKMRNACQRLSSISKGSTEQTDVFLMKINISQQMSFIC